MTHPFKQTPDNSLLITLVVIIVIPIMIRGSNWGYLLGGFLLGSWLGRMVRFAYELQAKIDRLTEENELLGEAICSRHFMTEATPRPPQ